MGQGGSSSTSRSDDGVLAVALMTWVWDVDLEEHAVNCIAHLLMNRC